MLRLLPVVFRRMLKSPSFWICVALMLVPMLYGIINNYYYSNLWELKLTPDDSLFSGNMMHSNLSAVFTCLFIGLEYENKTIRNKIIVGHSKTAIYLSNVIVCSIGALIMHLVPIIVNATLGTALLGGYEYPESNLVYILCSLFCVVAKTAIVVFFAMLIANRTFSLIFVLSMVFLLTSAGQRIESSLIQPEIYVFDVMDENLEPTGETYEEVNPNYVSGTKREILEFMEAFIPYAQEYRYGGPELPENIAVYPIYSLLFIVLATGGGVLMFRRKDIN